MRDKHLWFGLKYVSSALMLLIAVSCGAEEKKATNKVIKVNVVNVGVDPTSTKAHIEYNGTIKSNVAINSSFQVSGTVLSVPVRIGDFVKKNQLIAQIDPTIYTSQYDQQRAQERLAKENYERINSVFQKGSIAEIRMLEARSQYEQAQAAVKMTYQNVRHAKLYAPMDGYVSEKMMEAGDLAQPGQPVIELVNIKTVKAALPIPDNEINNIAKGDTASVVIPALDNMDISGTVDEISIQSDLGSPVYTAFVKLNNSDNKIKPGMTCTVSFKNTNDGNTNEKQTIIIPSESIAVTEDDRRFVYVVNGNSADRRYVETGKLYDEGIVIKKGLNKGDQLIVSGYHKLTQSTQVEIINDSK
ncbi:efflux RND transporter periplasmic adaptor subunit [uncultured Kriegella sp.]|uniref:efflux RND transporter periplasmic adaptor subunit n=1 Tax=uncultured Kriegella sp. TaxID=1798910 RepID=UPI0030DA0827|tara:strand:- start:31769 stop:32842 length:1074 start_codon:yes stop_codon:yes gene_type:complete